MKPKIISHIMSSADPRRNTFTVIMVLRTVNNIITVPLLHPIFVFIK